MALQRHQLAAGLREVASRVQLGPPPSFRRRCLTFVQPDVWPVQRIPASHGWRLRAPLLIGPAACHSRRQDWANWCLTACVIVATAVVAGVAEPHQVPYVIWGEPGGASLPCTGRLAHRSRLTPALPLAPCSDARIAYPLNSEVDTIPAW